jgi:hypothetical protein
MVNIKYALMCMKFEPSALINDFDSVIKPEIWTEFDTATYILIFREAVNKSLLSGRSYK